MAARASKRKSTKAKTKKSATKKSAAKKPVAKRSKAKPVKAKPAKLDKPKTLRLPPFPDLVWDRYNRWRGTELMPAWAGLRFFSKWMKRRARPDDGTVDLAIEPPVEGGEPDAVQRATYEYLKRNERAIAKAVLARLLADYPEAKRAYDESVDETWPVLPEIADVAGLGAVIGPPTIHIHSNVNNEADIGTIGFAFDCAWDEEHQLSVLTHGDEVLEVGDGSVAGFINE